MKNLHQIREISTLSFNERVLQEAEDRRNPLMERLKFLGIFSSNMDEFFKVRVASIHRRVELGNRAMLSVLEHISEKSRELDERFQAAYADITESLAREGIRILTERDIEESQHPQLPGIDDHNPLASWLDTYFKENVLPKLVPIIIQRDRAFPPLVDGALYFAVKMWGESARYAILEIPSDLNRFVELPGGDIMYVDDVIRHSLNDVFYIFEYDRIEAFEFKISRDAELDMDNDFSDNYVRRMERELQQRKGGRPTRLVYDAAMPEGLLQVLCEELQVSEEDTIIGGARYHNMKDLIRFPNHLPELSDSPLQTVPHPILDHRQTPMLETIRKRDLLVTYPYQSFDHVLRLLREAAIDPDVDEIKMTLYRAASPSQVVNALVNAARNGKDIFVSIELQARFDEKNNIHLAQTLSEAGASVVYGVPPMKTHCKLMLIKRKGLRYAGLSTGNFNEVTGALYVDSTLLTVDRRLAAEVDRVFEFLRQASRMRMLKPPKFSHLLVSPFNTRSVILKELAKEQEKRGDGYVFLKVNHLTDSKIIRRIRQAADAGVSMDLVVRTTYAMLPHRNIRAISILDRFLEHQRVYIFGKGEDCRVYMSSADFMERNLDWRVEVAFPIYDKGLRLLVAHMMQLQCQDSCKARILDETQSNRYVGDGNDGHRAQYETHKYLLEVQQRSKAQV